MRLLPLNPLEALQRPRAPKPSPRVLDAGGAKKLLEAAAEEPWLCAFVALGLGSGARLGELLGATWGDLNLKERTWTIARALVEDPKTGRPEIAETKTGKKHTVELPASTVEVLARYRGALERGWSGVRLEDA